MAKIGIVQLPLFVTTISFKKYVLMFDKIMFLKESFDWSLLGLRKLSKKFPKHYRSFLNDIEKNVEFLHNHNLLEFVSTKDFKSYDNTQLEEEIKEWLRTTDKELVDENFDLKTDLSSLERCNQIVNFAVRVFSRIISEETSNDVIPVIDRFNKSEKTKKIQVYNFVLHSIPEPKNSADWKQIIDFKNDLDVRKKYFRLINWINETAKGELEVNEIEDKFKELLFEYQDMYRIHKLKYNLSTLEITTKIISELVSFQFSKAHESFFSIFRQEANLLESEAKLTGKELAYIDKIEQTFQAIT